MVGPKRVVVQPLTPRKIQTSVFRVHIHCDGCKKKVKKIVKKIKGVESIAIDAELGKLTVVGYTSPSTVIQKLAKSGKHAEMWGAYKSNDLGRVNNQFKNMQVDFYDSGAEKKQGHGRTGGSKQVQLARKGHKPVKFEFTDEDEDEFYKGEGRDGFSDTDDGFELDFGRDSHKKPGKGGSKDAKATKGKAKKEKKPKKKGGFFGFFRLGKKDKNKGHGGKKGSGGGGPRKSYSREEIYGGKASGKSLGHVKNGSGNDYGGIPNGKNPPRHGGPAHQGKKSEPSFEIDLFDRSRGGGGAGRGRGGGGPPGGRLASQPAYPGGYPGGPAPYEAHNGKVPPTYHPQMGNLPMMLGPAQYQDHAKVGNPSMNQAGMSFPMNQAGMSFPMNQAGMTFPMNQAGMNFPMNQVPGVLAATGVNGYGPGPGHYPQMGQGGMCNPAQYMAMMGQQQAQWNGMARPMMYGGPNPRPSFSHAAQAIPARYTDRYTLMFNDENTESCSIM
ncbi:hypothetical protein MLD38_027756 [Melastoma candidum]|uniref:Uncharacterized protein n=1 Tax=Melastoma candidum TaxID=119954 RepID=A0ACB9P2J9_9MYRT|nr:hypothetical protein MLD38_027756 [Melastoma candidum]